MSLDSVVSPAEAGATVCVCGEVDVDSAEELVEALCGAARIYGPQVTADLGCVSFMDCRGITALLTVRARLNRLGGQLWIANPSPPVVFLLELCGLLDQFAVVVDGDLPVLGPRR